MSGKMDNWLRAQAGVGKAVSVEDTEVDLSALPPERRALVEAWAEEFNVSLAEAVQRFSPTSPPGNAGSGAGTKDTRRAPDMNDYIRAKAAGIAIPVEWLT